MIITNYKISDNNYFVAKLVISSVSSKKSLLYIVFICIFVLDIETF